MAYDVVSVSSDDYLFKQPGEKRQYSIDFANLMSSGETFDGTPTIVSELKGGGASDLTITSVGTSGQIVTMWISGGTDSKSYRIQATITTSTGQILVGDGILKVTDR